MIYTLYMYYMYYNQITYSVLNFTLARGLVDPIGKTRGFKIRLYEKTCFSGYLIGWVPD